MTLSETARGRLEDVRELQPMTNGELRELWDMDSGKDVAAILRNDLGEYTYRDDNDRIRVTDNVPGPDADGAQPDAVSQQGGVAPPVQNSPDEQDASPSDSLESSSAGNTPGMKTDSADSDPTSKTPDTTDPRP